MRKVLKAALSTAVLATTIATAAPAFAQDEPASDITITGNVALATEYRLRGISQTDGDAAIQGAITVSHSSGLYVGTWASNLAGYGTFGGSDMELDLIGGYTKAIGGATLDGGVVYYVYPGTSGHEYFELYGSVGGKVGPVNAKLGTYWAPKQDNIGGHNIWVYTDLGFPIEGTPITLKGHVGYSDGTSGYTWGGDVIDYSVGADLAFKNLTLNVSYVGTDIGKAQSAFWDTTPGKGRDITKGKVVASLTASF
jgi:uncharacterized protein (TIGR02001 family)